jgi:hypothetical protein
MGDKTTSHHDKHVSLVFCNIFESEPEPISLTPESCMQRRGVSRLYERAASHVPSLSVCPVENVGGRVPLIPCYLHGNAARKIPHCFRGRSPKEAGVAGPAAADSRPESGTGSRLFSLFEINMWSDDANAALWEGLSSTSACGASCGKAQKEGAGSQGTRS